MTDRIDIEFVSDTWRKKLDLYLLEHAHGMNGYIPWDEWLHAEPEALRTAYAPARDD